MRPGLNYPNIYDQGVWNYWHYTNFSDWVTATGEAGWTVAGGTFTRHASVGAPLLIVGTANTDNSPGGIKRTDAALQFRDDSPFMFRARALYTEAVTTGIANGFIGVSDQAIAAILGDDGAGPAAAHDGAGFFWADGGEPLGVWAGNGADVFEQLLTAGNRNNLTGRDILASSAGIRDWQIHSKPTVTGHTEIIFLLNGELVAHVELPTATAALMGSALITKSGDATNEQSIRIYNVLETQDYVPLITY